MERERERERERGMRERDVNITQRDMRKCIKARFFKVIIQDIAVHGTMIKNK